MSLASSNVAAPRDVKIGTPSEPLRTGRQLRQSWWRSLWFRRDGRLADIRNSMLAQLAAVTDEGTGSVLACRIAAAEHPEALWSLRQDLMRVLVEVHGEMLARRRLTDITFMFAGLLDRQRHGAATAGDPRDAADWPVPRGLVRNAAHLRTDH